MRLIIAFLILVSSAQAQSYLCQYKYQGFRTKDGGWGFGVPKEVNYIMKLTDSTINIGDKLVFKIADMAETEEDHNSITIRYEVTDGTRPAFVEFVRFKDSKRTAILVSYEDEKYVLTVRELLK